MKIHESQRCSEGQIELPSHRARSDRHAASALATEKVAADLGIDPAAVRNVVETFFAKAREEILRFGALRIPGFGALYLVTSRDGEHLVLRFYPCARVRNELSPHRTPLLARIARVRSRR
jgi:hypothetical protein